MFRLFIVLLSFSESLVNLLLSNDEPCMVRPTLIYMNPTEVKHYPFMISLNQCTGSCNVLSPKICVPKETKDTELKHLILFQAKIKLKH